MKKVLVTAAVLLAVAAAWVVVFVMPRGPDIGEVGGYVATFLIDGEEPNEAMTLETVASVQRRLDPAALRGITVTGTGPRIEVAVPVAKGREDEAPTPDHLARMLTHGRLSLRLAAEAGVAANVEWYAARLRGGIADEPGQEYRWFAVRDPASWAYTEKAEAALRDSPEDYFAWRGLVARLHEGTVYLLLGDLESNSISGAQRDWSVVHASPTRDMSGFPAVSFTLDAGGAARMERLTSLNQRRALAIVVGDEVFSAPTINDTIRDAGIITGGKGGFSEREMAYLIVTLGNPLRVKLKAADVRQVKGAAVKE